jgi:hypothetical protein
MATQPTDPIVRVAENDTTLPSTGLSNKLLPPNAILTTGYDANEIVPAEDLNYILDNFGKWLQYQKDVADSQIIAGDGLDSDVGSIGEGQTLSVDDTVVRTLRQILAGNGLVTGGNLSADVTVDMGTPSTTGAGSSNSVTADSHAHALTLDSNNISILTGIISDGATIPLPAGYTEGQCKWMISFHDINEFNGGWDIPESGNFIHLKSQCYTTGRVVNAKLIVNHTGTGFVYLRSTVNYMIIGVK